MTKSLPILATAAASLLCTAPLAAIPLPDNADRAPIVVDDDSDLRALAEIDGDPATFSADERRKMALLRQVLGRPTDAGPPQLPIRAEWP